MTYRTLFLLAGLILLAGRASAETDPHCFTGYAYHRDSGDFVYTEHHEQVLRDGRAVDWRVTYRAPDGEAIASKSLDFSHHPFVPVYSLEVPAHGYLEGIRRDGDEWRMFRRTGPDSERESETFEVGDDLAADSGFHPFVRDRFDALMAGDTVRFRFAAAGRQAAIAMRAERIGDTRFEGKRAVRFTAELDMFLVNWFVDNLELTYDPDSRRLLEYRGVTNLLDDEGNRYPVRVSYYTEKPPEATGVATACGGGNGS